MEDTTVRVMLVEDHKMVAQALAAILADQEGITPVGVAQSAEEAISLADATEPDVVLMDYQLPDRDGIAATRDVLERRPGTNVVILTARNEPSLLGEALEAGAIGFINKNAPMSELLAAVRAAAEGDSYLSSDLLAQLVRIRRAHAPLEAGAKAVALSELQQAILRLAASNTPPVGIAGNLNLTVEAIHDELAGAITKLGATNKLDAVVSAIRTGAIDLTQ